MKGSLLVTCFLLVGLGRGNTNRLFPRGDEAVINEAGYLATSYLVFGLNVSFYRLNYINPGRVVLFQDDCDLYPSVEVAPFSATGLSDLKNSFSGNFYYNSLSDQEDTEVLADISGIVSSSTPGREHGVFEAQFGEVFTWENVTYKNPPGNFTLVATNSSSAVFSFQDQTSPMNAVNFTVRCTSAEHSTNVTLSQEDLQVLGTVTVSDLQPFTEYQCSVEKSHAYGHVEPSRHLDIFTGVKSAPSVPVTLTVLERGSTYIVLGWSSPDPLMTGLPPATAYMVQMDGGPGETTSEAKYNFTGLLPMKEYTIAVSAINRFGQSNYSEAITSSTTEDAFEDVIVSDPSASSVNIIFKQPLTVQSEDDIQYIVVCMAVGVNGSNVSSTLNTSSIVEGVHQMTLTGLSPSTTYNCSVTRYHSAGSNATQYVMFVTDPPEEEEENEEGLSPGAIAGIVIGSVAAVTLAAVGLGGVAALVNGGAPCCGGEAAEAGEGADPVAITEAGISIAEFVKEHCTCCCKKKDDEEDKGSKKRVEVNDDNEDGTESMLKDDTTEETTAI